MTNAIRRTAGLAIAGLLVLACGGSPGATVAPTLAPGQTAAPTQAGASAPLPSIIPDQPLEDIFPDTIGGNAIEVESAQGTSVMTLFSSTDPTEFNEFLGRLGTTIDQVSAAFSFGIWPGPTAGEFTGLTMIALRARNVPATTTLQNLITIVQEDVGEGAQVSQTTLGGKSVTAVVDPEDPENSLYLYPIGDAVFMIGGTPPLVEEALGKLP